jgi:hypothetical protein
MKTFEVEINVEVLLETVRTNRDKHVKDYEKAKKGWQRLLKKELEGMLATLAMGGELQLRITSRKPESHVDDYDEAIGMLEMATNPTVSIDQALYRQFVNDNWDWKAPWVASNTTYIAAAR